MTAPTVVGLNRTQDASLCVARGRRDVQTLQKERVTRRKHHWGRLGDVPNVYFPRVSSLADPVDLVVECYSSDSEADRMAEYDAELRAHLSCGEVVRVSHHLAHVYSAFFPSPFDEAAVMVIDAQGSRARDFTEPYAADGDLLEVASFYRCSRTAGIECVGKQLWDGDWNRPAGLGCFYYLLTRMIFSEGEGAEGKVMGLAPFGTVGRLRLPPLHVDGNQVRIPDDWLKVFEERDKFLYADSGDAFRRAADLAAEGQHAFEEAVLSVAAWLRDRTHAANLCFAGGTALNCSANGRLLRESGFEDLFIPPSPHDGGTALGCAVYGMVEVLGQPTEFRWVNDFLGPVPDGELIEAAARAVPGFVDVEAPRDLEDRIAELLDAGAVVGVFDGRSESGPRALGHRSILADPRRQGMQDFINAQVKGREWFRPLAPIVLAEAAPTIFGIDRPAPFMQIAAEVRHGYRSALPAITHVDGTARLQTVDEQAPRVREVLERFRARTGCPVLLNTSLNGKGEPIVELPSEAVDCFTTTAMHALAMPPYLLVKR